MIEVPPLISVNEARRLLGGRGRGHIYDLMKSGALESVMDGSRRFIVSESLFAYIERLRNLKSSGFRQSDDPNQAAV